MCFGWTGAYHRSVEDWSSSVWTGKKDGFELQDNTFFLRICRFSCCSGACKREAWAWAWQKFHDPLVNWTSHWMLHNSKKWKKATVSLATGSKSERLRWDPQEICFFFFAGASPCKHGVFLKPWAWGRQKCPQIQDLPKMEWWFGSRNWKMGHLASEVGEIFHEAIAVGPWIYQADKSDDDMPKLSVALASKELTETYWDTCHASVAGETGGRGVHLAWVKTLRWFFAEDSQINWMIDWATLMAAIFPLLQKIGGRRLVATKSAEAR